MKTGLIIIGAFVLIMLLSTPASGSALSENDKKIMAALSYLDRADLPLALRNNNPGNIRPDGSSWQGMIGIDGKNNFVRFSAFIWGVRALIKQVRDADLGKHNIRSIRRLIEKYSPVSDNNKLVVENYIKALQRHTGFTDDIIPDDSKDTVYKISTGIANHESGRTDVIDTKMFEYAWILSLA